MQSEPPQVELVENDPVPADEPTDGDSDVLTEQAIDETNDFTPLVDAEHQATPPPPAVRRRRPPPDGRPGEAPPARKELRAGGWV